MINQLWDLCRNDVVLDYAEFVASFDGWQIDDFEKFMRVNLGPEMHFVIKPGSKITRADIRQCLAPLLEQYGFVTTKTPIHDIRQHRFNKLLGFTETSRDDDFAYFRIERMKHV